MIDYDFSRKNGKIIFDDFLVTNEKSLSDQIYELKEDMLQVELPGNYLLDIGWRPSFEINGAFKIVLIKNNNWESPVYSGSTQSLVTIKGHIDIALSKIL